MSETGSPQLNNRYFQKSLADTGASALPVVSGKEVIVVQLSRETMYI